MGRILIVDDEANMRRILSVILQEDGHQISEAGGAKEALTLIASTPFDLVITDKKMPDGDGFAVLSACQEADATLPVVMLTAFATVELAVEAMRMGAFDFITKPFVAEAVLAVTRRALERVKILRQNEQLKGEVRRLGFSDEILGESAAMRELKTKIARAAPTNATVLINGETGTGKELVARAIHKGSLRADETFLAVNCAAVSEQLLESELFGHEKGSFTGADRARQGLFEAAHRGTLFLDEAGEMSLGLQAKLLRVLTDGQVLRVGATVPRKVDVRILVATHRDLPERVRAGLFREDLYYRLAVIPLEIPPLRERREDVSLLVEHLLRQVSRELKTPKREIQPAALEKLLNYDFPGNIRELRNLIERACILALGAEITPADFYLAPGELTKNNSAGSSENLLQSFSTADFSENIELQKTLETIERELVQGALQAANFVQAEAARKLGISRSDIAYKIKKYGI
jgi:DNA-binding NtrC family response regulator